MLNPKKRICKGTLAACKEILELDWEYSRMGREIFSRVKDRGFMVVGRPLSVLYGLQGWSPALSQISATLRRLVLFSSLPCARHVRVSTNVWVRSHALDAGERMRTDNLEKHKSCFYTHNQVVSSPTHSDHIEKAQK